MIKHKLAPLVLLVIHLCTDGLVSVDFLKACYLVTSELEQRASMILSNFMTPGMLC